MANPETLTELLTRWQGRRVAYINMMRQDYGDDSPMKNQMLMTMENQLRICIEELEHVMSGNWLRAALAESIVKANRKEK